MRISAEGLAPIGTVKSPTGPLPAAPPSDDLPTALPAETVAAPSQDALVVGQVGESTDAQLVTMLAGLDPQQGLWQKLEAKLDMPRDHAWRKPREIKLEIKPDNAWVKPDVLIEQAPPVKLDPRLAHAAHTQRALDDAIKQLSAKLQELEESLQYSRFTPEGMAQFNANVAGIADHIADLQTMKGLVETAFVTPHRGPETDHVLHQLMNRAQEAIHTPDDRGLGRTKALSKAQSLTDSAMMGPGKPGNNLAALRDNTFTRLMDRLQAAETRLASLVALRGVVEAAPMALQSEGFWQTVAERVMRVSQGQQSTRQEFDSLARDLQAGYDAGRAPGCGTRRSRPSRGASLCASALSSGWRPRRTRCARRLPPSKNAGARSGASTVA